MLFRHIRYFLAVAKHGNFTRAADALHVSQPTLSQQIRQLEESLGAVLFDRSGRAVRLTDAGEVWARYARQVLCDLDSGARAIHDVAELSRGRLRLAATPTFTPYLMGSVIDEFHRRYPGITIDLHEITQALIEAMLADDKLDLGIAFEHAQSTDIESQPLFCETLSLVVGKDHPLASRNKALPDDVLAQAPLVLLNKEFATRQHIDGYCQRLGIEPNAVIDANSIGAIVEIVRRGRLATILPDRINLADSGLYPVPLDPPLPVRTAVLLLRNGVYRTAAGKAFVRLLAEYADERKEAF